MIRILQEVISSKCQYGNRLKKGMSVILVFFVMIACLVMPTDTVRAESSEIVTDLSAYTQQPSDQQIEDGKTYLLTSNKRITSYQFGYVNYGDGNECNIIIKDLTMLTGQRCSGLTFYNANGDWTINLYIDGTNIIDAGGWGGLCVNSSQYAGKTTINFCYVSDSSSITINGSSGGTQDATYDLPDQYKPEDAVLRTHSVEASLGANTEINTLRVAATSYTDINSAFNAAKTSRPLLVTLRHTHAADAWQHNENQHWKICTICNREFDRVDHLGGTATCSTEAVCDTCGESYGAVEPTNHSNLKHVVQKAPTAAAEGNTEYWYCDGCDKYYSDEDANNEISLKDTVIDKLTPTISDEDSDEDILKTGDETNMALLLALLLVSSCGMILTTRFIGKK